jgi:hypothetical protein
MSSRSCSVNGFPHRIRPDSFESDGDTFTVPGVAIIQARPHRRRQEARQLAKRVAADAASYLPVMVGLGIPGVTDCRPISHARGGSPFGYLLSA